MIWKACNISFSAIFIQRKTKKESITKQESCNQQCFFVGSLQLCEDTICGSGKFFIFGIKDHDYFLPVDHISHRNNI